jgi:hypothetical protein
MAAVAEVAIGVSCVVRFERSKWFDVNIAGDEGVIEIGRSVISTCRSRDNFTFE